MENDVVELSYNIFTASTVLIGIALILIPPSWKTIRERRLKYPHLCHGKFCFITDKSQNKRFRNEITRLNILLWGSIFLVGSIFFTLVAITGIGLTMLDIHGGFFQAENYNEAKWALAIGIGLFVIGFLLIGLIRIIESLSFLSNSKIEDSK